MKQVEKYFLGIILVFLGLGTSGNISAQKLATLTVESGSYARQNSVASVNLDGLSLALASHDLQVRELVDGHEIPVPAQLSGGPQTTLYWLLQGLTGPHQIRIYELWQVPKQTPVGDLAVEDDGRSLTVMRQSQQIISYQYEKAAVPPGVSEIYSRGGFIHPLWSPGGSVLTRIQPPDHYHHYGIWNPWTHTEFAGQEIDFWNLNKGQATVEVIGKPASQWGEVFAAISAIHAHVVFSDSTREERVPALFENFDLRVWNGDLAPQTQVVDLISTFSCASENELTLKEYRYQGFGYRARADWNDANTTLITSEGFNKENGNATRARWCMVEGPSENDKSGILFMTNPANFNFPELLRIWPTGANNGTENVFINFNPTQDRDWVLRPGESNTLKYRMVAYDGHMSVETANRLWNDYAHPPRVSLTPVYSFAGKRILVFTKNGKGYVHENIASSVQAIKKLGAENGFEVDATDSAAVFLSPRLSDYDAIVFSNSNNEVFETERQKVAFQEYIRSGKGFVGIHIACGTERNWPWFAKMLGGKFVRHPVLQKFPVEVIDRNHPSTNFLPETWMREDECYFMNELNPSNHVLLAARITDIVDEKKKDFPGDTFGEYCPLAWYHEFDGGKQWFSALGHSSEHYQDPVFMRHILGGIEWVTR